ncbi:hypothetical protein STENM327S_04077 [Streptomyces tendae]
MRKTCSPGREPRAPARSARGRSPGRGRKASSDHRAPPGPSGPSVSPCFLSCSTTFGKKLGGTEGGVEGVVAAGAAGGVQFLDGLAQLFGVSSSTRTGARSADPGLHGHRARTDGGGALLAVGTGLLLEPLHGRHRHHPRGGALGCQAPPGRPSQTAPRSRWRSGRRPGRRGGGVSEDVAAARRVRVRRVGRYALAGEGEAVRRGVGGVPPEDAAARAGRRLVGVGGADDVEAGWRAAPARCWSRLVGRAVLAKAEQSCVGT